MPRRTFLAKRLSVLAALAAFTWTATPHADRLQSATDRGSLFEPARTESFVAAFLPGSLKPPSVDLQRTFLSLLAADIDADGDLDVVGIDEFRKLVVWENDGTGHLTRKRPAEPQGSGARSAAPLFDDQPAVSQGLVQHRSVPLTLSQTRCVDACGYLPRFNLSTTGPQSRSVSTHSPRGPPSPAV